MSTYIVPNGSAALAVRQALPGDYPAHFAASGYAVVVLGMNIETGTGTLAECVKWDLGHYDSTKGQWEDEPFAVPLLRLVNLPEREKDSLELNPGLASSNAGEI